MNCIVDILFLAEIEVLIYLKRQLSLNTYLNVECMVALEDGVFRNAGGSVECDSSFYHFILIIISDAVPDMHSCLYFLSAYC